jgi:O-antigen ligase
MATKNMDKKTIINTLTAGILFCVLCSIALFVTSSHFVNRETSPKWFGLIIGVGLASMAWSIFYRTVYFPARSVFVLFLLFTVFVFLRDLIDSGFDYRLSAYSVCLILLFFVIQQTVSVCPVKYLFGIIFILTLLLAVYGILQYARIFPTLNYSFRITGKFDNPAGYATALACVFPVGFYFLSSVSRPVKYISISLLVIIFAGIVLSESRAAIFASLAGTVCYFGNKYSKRYKNRIKTILLCTIAAAIVVLYSFKKDSADGRLLILQNTLDMIWDKPVAGHGYGAFNEKYMLYQADYFDANPDSKYSLLADNVLHPFNEYLLVLAEHGIIGPVCLLLLLLMVLRSYLRERTQIKFIAVLGILSLMLCSCFSYPFKYPFAWIIALFNLALICPSIKISSRKASVGARAGTGAVAVLLLFIGVALMKAEMRWNTIAKQSLAGKTMEMLPKYDKLYKYLDKNGLFLYNHAAELHEVGEYEKSLSVFEQCIEHYNDYDVQMLIADNHNNLKQYDKAEFHLKRASAMCPVRFMPLYQLVELYRATDRMNEAIVLAQQILDKKVKIPSSSVNAIKNKMEQLINEQKTK